MVAECSSSIKNLSKEFQDSNGDGIGDVQGLSTVWLF